MTNSTWLIDLEAHLVKHNMELTSREKYLATPLYLNVAVNPKQKKSMSFQRFEGYFSEGVVSIGDAMNAGLRQDDIRHDAEHGFILLGDAANTAYELDEMAAEEAGTVDWTEVLKLAA